MAPGVAVILGIVLGLAEITPASWRLQRAMWRRSEGPAGQGLVLVKAGGRGSEGSADGRTAYVGCVLGFFESFPFFQIRRRLQAFVGPVAQHSFVFRAVLVP